MAELDQITFQYGPAQLGQVTLFTAEEEAKLVFVGTNASNGQRVSMTSTNRTRRVRREEVVDVRGLVAQRVRVSFIEDVNTSESNGKRERVVGPFAGNTFEIERKSDRAGLSVFDAAGAPARFGVAAQVAGLYRDFGREDTPAIKLPSGPQRVGQSAPEIAESMAAGVARGAAITKVEDPEATLAEIRQGPNGVHHGLYRVALKVTGESEGSLVTLDLKGTILLRDVDGAPLEIRLSGPLQTIPDPNNPDTASSNVPAGAGEFKMVHTMVYAKA
jgi:hypothetical protein